MEGKDCFRELCSKKRIEAGAEPAVDVSALPPVTEVVADVDQSEVIYVTEEQVIEEPEDILADALFLSPAFSCLVRDKLFEVPVVLGSMATSAMVDTGASVNMVSEAFAKTLQISRVDSVTPDCNVRVANGAVVRPLTKIFISVKVNNKVVGPHTPFLVMPNLPYPVIIGLMFLKENSVSLIFGPESNRLVIRDKSYVNFVA